MESYRVLNMMIDDDFAVEEYVTVEYAKDRKVYSITFKKADLEVINAWLFENGTSYPAEIPHEVLESIRDDVRKRI